jgi:hypothetical protein
MKKGTHMNPDSLAKRSASQTGLRRSKETRRKMSEARKGMKFTEEHRYNLSISHTGYVMPDSTKAKISATETGRKWSKEQHSKQDGKCNIPPEASARGRANSLKKIKGKKLKKSTLIKRAKTIASNPKDPRYVSNAESRILNYLKNYFEVYPQFIIDGYYHPYDMLVKLTNGIDLLIEYDGDYWHSSRNPRWDSYKDAQREFDAVGNGYEFLIIKESEFRKGDLKFVKSQVAKFMPEFANMHLKT